MENASGIVHSILPKKKCPPKKKTAPPTCIPKYNQNGEAYIDAQRKIEEFFRPYPKENVTGLGGW